MPGERHDPLDDGDDDPPDPEFVAWALGSNVATDVGSHVFVDSEEEEEDAVERARFAEIRERESRATRPWRTSSAPVASLSGKPQRFALEGGKEVVFCDRPFPPHGGEIVATGGIIWDSALVLSQCVQRPTRLLCSIWSLAHMQRA